MRAYHVAGFLALLFWQVAPVQVESGPGGRFRISIAGSSGAWEDYQKAQFDCNGSLNTPERSSVVGMRSVGARADVFLGNGDNRVTVVGGTVRADSAWVGSGTFWGAELALDGGGVGASFGVRHAGDALLPAELRHSDGGISPSLSFSLRLGRADREHAVLQFGPLSETPNLAGEVRIGLGYGAERKGFSTLWGLVEGPKGLSGGRGLAGFGEMTIPLTSGVDVLLRGVYGGGHLSPHWGVGGGVRVGWGR
ncbi:MAG: hypothetical protein ABSB58_02675 [Gemmatimonadales bacterium]|jgi:hypothetical protein